MLKEAIAEAKTIKDTAIASAKAALTEAFTPQLTAMFAEKLNELEEEYVTEEVDEMYDKNELEEDFNLEEILAELESADENYSMEGEDTTEALDEDLMLEEMSDEEIEELVMKVIEDMIESGKLMAGEEAEADMEDMEDMGDMEDMEDTDGEEAVEFEEEVDIDELLSEILDAEAEPLNEAADWFIAMADAINVAPSVLAAALGVSIPVAGTAAAFLSSLKDKKGKSTETSEAKEMEDTINELRKELNEVNLLNAKLLYTNKIFKAKNLTESEKIKVLNTFDKAETIKEVKLVYETINESFKVSTKKNSIKESLGSASKTMAPATPKQPIIEVNDAFIRMQQIAGLRK